MLLHERQRPGFAVYGRGGAEDDALHAVRAHSLEQPKRTANVDVVVTNRHGDRLAHRFEAGEVNDRSVAAGGEHAFEECAIAHVAGLKLYAASGEPPDSCGDARAAIHEAVDDANFVAGLHQLHAGMRADVPGPAGHENPVAHADVRLRFPAAAANQRSSHVSPFPSGVWTKHHPNPAPTALATISAISKVR